MTELVLIPDLATNPQADLSSFLAADGRFLDIVKACRQPKATESGLAAVILKLRHPDGSHSWARTTHALFVTCSDAFKGAYLREIDLGTTTPPPRPEITDPTLAHVVELLDSVIADLHKMAAANNAPLLRAVADMYQAPLDKMLAAMKPEAGKPASIPSPPAPIAAPAPVTRPPGSERCSTTLRLAGKPYPRTCAECKLGPCKFPESPAPVRSGLTTDHDDPGLKETYPDGQQKVHVVLSEEERGRGYVRPVRRTYVHTGCKPANPLRDLTAEEKVTYADCGNAKFEEYPKGSPLVGRYWTEKDLAPKCGAETTMPQAIAETWAADPRFYGSTFCTCCKKYLPVGEFVWKETNEPLGT